MFHLGSIGGTSIDVDFSFLMLIVLFVLTNHDRNQPIQYALVWAPIVFVSVLGHEIAHAAAIALLGYGSSRIILGGMGGVTINARRARPWQDMVISLAGPIASFLMAWLTGMVMAKVAAASTDPMFAVLLPKLYWANIAWGIFNLLPVSPLDGGHAVRNFLRTFLKERPAFIIAVWIAMIAGTGFVVLSLVGRQFFVGLLIGWFVYQNFQQWQHFRERGIPGD
jgi:stage IV sporulation protein FB